MEYSIKFLLGMHIIHSTACFHIKLSLSQFSSVQSLIRVQLFATPWIAARQASLSITNSRSSLRLTSIESVMPSSHLILCHPLLLLPPIPPSILVLILHHLIQGYIYKCVSRKNMYLHIRRRIGQKKKTSEIFSKILICVLVFLCLTFHFLKASRQDN